MAYLNLNGDPDLLETKSKGDQWKTLPHETEKNDYENISKSLKIDNDFYGEEI